MHKIILLLCIAVVFLAFFITCYSSITSVEYKPISITMLFDELSSYKFTSDETLATFEVFGQLYGDDYDLSDVLPDTLPKWFVALIELCSQGVQGVALFLNLIKWLFVDFVRAIVFTVGLLSRLLVPA